jgi:hypothetical protein
MGREDSAAARLRRKESLAEVQQHRWEREVEMHRSRSTLKTPLISGQHCIPGVASQSEPYWQLGNMIDDHILA